MTSTKRLVQLAGASFLCLVIVTAVGSVGNETGTLAEVLHWMQMGLLLTTIVLALALGVSYLRQRTARAS